MKKDSKKNIESAKKLIKTAITDIKELKKAWNEGFKVSKEVFK